MNAVENTSDKKTALLLIINSDLKINDFIEMKTCICEYSSCYRCLFEYVYRKEQTTINKKSCS